MKNLFILLFIALTLFADSSTNIEKIKNHISKTFLKTYPNMHINDIEVKRYSNIPREFERYKLKNIFISENNLKRDKGTITVLFTYGKKRRKLHYHYKIDATVDVLRANQYIQAGKTLTGDLVDFITIKFTNFYQVPITTEYLNRYRARTSLINGKILTTRHVAKITDVKRGDILTTTLRDGGVIVTFPAQALKDAYIGDIIKVKRNHQSFFHVRVTSATSAEVVK